VDFGVFIWKKSHDWCMDKLWFECIHTIKRWCL